MADLLLCNHNNLLHSSSSRFLPFNLSPLSNFRVIRFSSRKRRFSHSSLLAKLSSQSDNSSKFDIISTTEYLDGSFVFKFGDASETSESIENVEGSDTASSEDGENEVELERESVESDYIKVENAVNSAPESKEIVKESTDSVADSIPSEDSVEGEENNELILTAEVETSDDYGNVEHEISEINNVVEITDSTVDVMIKEMSDDSKLEISERDSDAENSDKIVALKDTEVEEDVEHVVDEDDAEMIELMKLPVQFEAEPILDEEVSAESVDAVVVAMETGLGSEKVNNAVPSTLSQADEYACANDTIEGSGLSPAESGSTSPEISPVSFNNVDISTAGLSASPAATSLSLPSEVNDAGHPSIAGPVDDSCTSDISDAAVADLEASGLISAETTCDSGHISTPALFTSSAAGSLPHLSEVNDVAPPAILRPDDDPRGSDVTETAGHGPESTIIASTETSPDSVPISTVGLSTPPAAPSSPHAVEADDDDLCSEISVVAVPGPASRSSAETNPDSLNEMKISAPFLFLTSAAASLDHPLEALTGGEDAYFVCENWFGVADGVDQWSFEGIDKGLYAQEFMRNCETLVLKSENAGLINVKELLQQSAAVTKSTGSARVLIAHFIDQVLHVANIGDSGFVIIRNGAIFKKSSPMVHEFNFPYAIGSSNNSVEAAEEYHVGLEEGDVIVTATDGLFDNLYEQEICSLVSEAMKDGKKMKDLAELLAIKAQEVGRSASARSPFADAAQAAGHTGFNGAKLDHVTVIVSVVQRN